MVNCVPAAAKCRMPKSTRILISQSVGIQSQRQRIEIRRKFVPEFRLASEGDFKFNCATGFGPLNVALRVSHRVGWIHRSLVLDQGGNCSAARLAGRVFDLHFDADRALLEIGKNLNIFNPNRIGSPQLDPADNAVEVPVDAAVKR